jgi:hypothetical protein
MTQTTERIWQVGQAVYHVSSSQRWKLPLDGIPAVIISLTFDKPRIRKHTGQMSTVRFNGLAYRGYCADCEVPAHEHDGQLVCPKCERPAIPTPPPDELTIRWCGRVDPIWQMAVYRSAMEPGLTWSQAWDAALSAFKAIQEQCSAKLAGLGLEVFEPRTSHWLYDYQYQEKLWYLSYVGDELAFIETYHAWEEYRNRKPVDIATILDALYAERERRQLNLAPKWQPPADDQQPDKVDDFTAWLERKMQRRAA